MTTSVFYALGCRANQYQSEALKGQYPGQILKFGEKADIYIINTCTVTKDADRKSRKIIKKALKSAKRVIVYGCYARLNEKELIKEFPSLEIISTKTGLPQITTDQKTKIRANLMIEDGCENFCSYCVIPFARGKVIRKPLEEILGEAKILLKNGAREIVLTGINLGAWGNLAPILKSLSPIKELLRIRLSSIEPQYVTKELLKTMASLPKVCKHLHIPLQSGDDKVLKAMNRKYSVKEYLHIIEGALKYLPECGITTDIIVGFPGETEKEFQNTIKLVNQIQFSRIHIFSYSLRELTSASKLPDQIEEETKMKRYQVLEELKTKYQNEFAHKYFGKEVEILVESLNEGLTSNFLRVRFNNQDKSLISKLHKISLTRDNFKL